VVVVVGCLTSDVDPLHTLDGRSHRFCPYPVVQMLEPLFLPVLLCGVQVLLFLGEGEEGVVEGEEVVAVEEEAVVVEEKEVEEEGVEAEVCFLVFEEAAPF